LVPKRNEWSQAVPGSSGAVDLEPGVSTWPDAAEIARCLKRSAGRGGRREADRFRPATSVLSFRIDRAGADDHPPDRRFSVTGSNAR
jgi:hypothetical protein